MTNIIKANPVVTTQEDMTMATRLKACVDVRLDMNKILADIPENLVYDRGTRDMINHTSLYLQEKFKDVRAIKLRKSLKRDLVETIRSVCKESLVKADNECAKLAKRESQIRTPFQRAISRERNLQLVAQVKPFKSNFSVSEWNTFERLVANGYVAQQQLQTFGINI